METATKICTKCKIEKSITEFHNRKINKDGKSNDCKNCINEKASLYRMENPDKIKEQKAKEYIKNKNKHINKRKKYYELNKDAISDKNKQYRDENKEKLLKQKKEYYEKNKDIINDKHKKWMSKNKEYIVKYRKKLYENNKQIMSDKKKKNYALKREYYIKKVTEYRNTEFGKIVKKNSENKRRTIKKEGDVDSNQLNELYSNTKACYWCNEKLTKGNIHLDHYIPLSKGGLHTLSNLVLSCSRCNLKKSTKDPLLFAQEMGRLL